MAKNTSISLGKHFESFISSQIDAGRYGNASEFVRHLIRDRKDRQDASALRQAVLEGFADVRGGRTRAYTGDLRTMLDTFRAGRDGP